ncbi:MAG: tyrosine-type recombinase/integrase [Rhodospirillales bacterium]
MPRVRLTQTFVERVPLGADGKQTLYFDTETKGFGLLVSRATKSWVVQRDIDGRSKRITLGRADVVRAEEARRRARAALDVMAQGTLPVAVPTLKDALSAHRDALVRRKASPLTIRDHDTVARLHLAPLLDRRLDMITPEELYRLHVKVTDRAGPYAANRVIRVVRAAWNTARRRLPKVVPLPEVGAVEWNKETRRREPIAWTELPAWFKRVHGLSWVMRDYMLFVLLTGLRRRDASAIRWEEIDWRAGTLYRPAPKGGADRAFTIPLSRKALAVLRLRRMTNSRLLPASPWAFPTRSRDGKKVIPLQEPGGNGLPSPHRLRDTYATAALEAGVDLFTRKVLMNHALSGTDVTEGYQRPSLEHLRRAQETITSYLWARLL